MSYDPEVANSSGFFKDPVTKEDLSVDTPRVVPCKLENGKFTWPCVLCSDGTQLLKIVYKYFTDEEKQLYKQYRGYGESKPREPKQPKPKVQTVQQSPEIDVSEKTLVKYDADATACPETMSHIKECDKLVGIANVGGLTYALITRRDLRKIYCIPQSLIPPEDMRRLV